MSDYKHGDVVALASYDKTEHDECPREGCTSEYAWIKPWKGKHWGRLECVEDGCDQFITWVAKPGNQDKPRRKSGRIRPQVHTCEICLRHQSILPDNETIEEHHIKPVKNGGSDEPENILVVCTACHSWIEHRRTYLGDHVGRQVEALMNRGE